MSQFSWIAYVIEEAANLHRRESDRRAPMIAEAELLGESTTLDKVELLKYHRTAVEDAVGNLVSLQPAAESYRTYLIDVVWAMRRSWPDALEFAKKVREL